MSDFFVIKGNPHRWYDQWGQYIGTTDAGSKVVPLIKQAPQNAKPIGVDFEIDDPDKLPIIKLWYTVRICKDEAEVKALAL